MEESLVAVLGKHILDKSLLTGKVCNYDDDSVDRLNHLYTTAIFGLCVTFMFTRQVVGKPISCWLPSEFSDSQVQYAENICWALSTYYVKLDETVPFHIYRKVHQLHYYQWFPFILIGQALFYVVPYIIWSLFNKKYRKEIIHTMQNLVTLDIDTPTQDRQQNLNRARHHFLQFLLLSRSSKLQYPRPKPTPDSTEYVTRFRRTYVRLWPGEVIKFNSSGFYIVIIYLICKTLYFANNIIQLILMSKYLQINNIYYGWVLLMDMLYRNNLYISETSFPRITFCDFEILALGQSLRYTSQCVLAVNMFNEKIYLFLWIWNVMLMFFNCYSFLTWCYRFGSTNQRLTFLSNLLSPVETNPAQQPPPPSYLASIQEEPCTSSNIPRNQSVQSNNQRDEIYRKEKLTEFFQDFLRLDGIFIIQLLHNNLGSSTSSQFVQFLFDKYRFKNRRNNFVQSTTNNELTMHQLERNISSISYNEIIRNRKKTNKTSSASSSQIQTTKM